MCPCDVACKTVRLVEIHMQSYGVSHVIHSEPCERIYAPEHEALENPQHASACIIPSDAAAQKEEPF